MRRVFIATLLIFAFLPAFAEDEVCMSRSDAVKVIETLKQCQIDKQIVENQEQLIENLKEQNSLLREQIKLLQESLAIQKNQTELYKTAYEEEKKKSRWSWISKGMYLGIGILLGFVVGIVY